jgi:hypothetical protein
MAGRPIIATARLESRPQAVYALLSDLGEHWRLADPWVDPVELGPDGGVVRLTGPLGISRTVRTRVVHTEAPVLLAGEAALGATRAAVRWRLVADGEGTRVELRADVLEAGFADRLLLALGGRRWLRGRFRATLRRLAAAVANSPHAALGVAVG